MTVVLLFVLRLVADVRLFCRTFWLFVTLLVAPVRLVTVVLPAADVRLLVRFAAVDEVLDANDSAALVRADLFAVATDPLFEATALVRSEVLAPYLFCVNVPLFHELL